MQLLFISDHSDQGYPGTLSCTVTIELVADNRVLIEYEGISDHPTFFNPTHHFYFNLSATAEPATAHELYLNAATIIATNAEYIPTGKRTPVENTAYDFRHHRIIGDQTFYNECYVLDKKKPKEVAAQLTDPSSGRSMTITTTFPGIVFYTGDLLRSPFKKSQGICLETQFFPDAPNRPEFPSTRVEPGIKFNHTTQYQFTAALPDLVKGIDFIN